MSDDNKNVKGLSEEMAISVVKEFVGNNMYVLLSTVKALYFFSTYEYAKEFVEENDFEILDGIYPLAKLEPGEKMNSFETICAIAAHLGIMYIDFKILSCIFNLVSYKDLYLILVFITQFNKSIGIVPQLCHVHSDT